LTLLDSRKGIQPIETCDTSPEVLLQNKRSKKTKEEMANPGSPEGGGGGGHFSEYKKKV